MEHSIFTSTTANTCAISAGHNLMIELSSPFAFHYRSSVDAPDQVSVDVSVCESTAQLGHRTMQPLANWGIRSPHVCLAISALSLFTNSRLCHSSICPHRARTVIELILLAVALGQHLWRVRFCLVIRFHFTMHSYHNLCTFTSPIDLRLPSSDGLVQTTCRQGVQSLGCGRAVMTVVTFWSA